MATRRNLVIQRCRYVVRTNDDEECRVEAAGQLNKLVENEARRVSPQSVDIFVARREQTTTKEPRPARCKALDVMIWGDFFFPILAYGVSLLALSAGGAAFHRVRVWRSRKAPEPSVVVRLEQPAICEPSRDERRAA